MPFCPVSRSKVETMQKVMGSQHPTVLHCITEIDNILKEQQHKESQYMVPFKYVMQICFKAIFDPFYLASHSGELCSGP